MTTKAPVNLRELFGSRYRVVLDESARQEPGGNQDPWLFQIPCKFGDFYPHSDSQIGFYCKSGRIRDRLHRELPDIEVNQMGDGEAVFLFAPEQFDLVVRYAKPKRKPGPRRLSADHRNVLVSAGVAHRFASDSTGDKGTLGDRDGQETLAI